MKQILKISIFITLLILSQRSEILIAQNNIDSLKQLLSSALSDTAKAKILSSIGDGYLLKNQAKASIYYKQSNTIYKQLNDTTGIFNTTLGLCDSYSLIGEYKQAIKTLNTALELAINKPKLLGDCYNRIAVEYDNMGNYHEYLLYTKLSLKYYIEQKDTLATTYALNNLSRYYLENNNLDSALIYLTQSQNIQTSSDNLITAYNRSLAALLERKKGDYQKALQLHKKALNRFLKDSALYDAAIEDVYIAQCYNFINQRDSAFMALNKAIDISKKINNLEIMQSAYHLMYKLYKADLNYKDALKYSILEKEYADSLHEKNKENIIQNFKIQNKLIKQEEVLKHTQKMNKELNKQRTQLFIFSAIVLFLFLISLYLLIQKRKEQKKNTTLLEKLNVVNDTLRTTLSIIGHDLKESIGSLKTFTEYMHLKLLDKKSIEELIIDFVPLVESSADLLDNILTWSKNNNENFTPELQKVSSQEIIERTIIHVRHIAHTKNIEFNIEDENISFIADPNMINIILRNLVTNAIKFSETGSEILIKTCLKNKLIEFSVTDYGVGMSEEQINLLFDKSNHFHTKGTNGENGSGLGLTLCNSFLSKQHGKFSVKSTPGSGTTFTFTLPIE